MMPLQTEIIEAPATELVAKIAEPNGEAHFSEIAFRARILNGSCESAGGGDNLVSIPLTLLFHP